MYHETFIDGDGEASYNARMEKIDILDEATDGMLFGDINENGKIDEDDATLITGFYNFEYYDFNYGDNDENWIYCYYTILGDIYWDEFCGPEDDSFIYEILAGIADPSYQDEIIRPYKKLMPGNTEVYYLELDEELISYNY